MKTEIETEHLPPIRPHNWRRLIVIIACTAIFFGSVITVCSRLGSVSRKQNTSGYEPGLRGPGGYTGQRGAPGGVDHTGGVETLTEGNQNLTESKGIVEGIIAGTPDGVVIIPLDSLEQRTISITYTDGVAFNWRSRKVYWVEDLFRIKIADLDGSSAELLISHHTSALRGIAVDQITGNFYYGVTGSESQIRVCDSTGKKCETVASGVNNVGYNIWDIALFPSQGLMFWSDLYHKTRVIQANMDGTNASVIILEDIRGLDLDEFAERLYWTNFYGKNIAHSDLNGNNRNVLLNSTMYPDDLAVDGDTLYFGNYGPNGVYSVASNGKFSFIAKTTAWVSHIALYGRNKVSSRRNPCKNSPCANLWYSMCNLNGGFDQGAKWPWIYSKLEDSMWIE